MFQKAIAATQHSPAGEFQEEGLLEAVLWILPPVGPDWRLNLAVEQREVICKMTVQKCGLQTFPVRVFRRSTTLKLQS